MKSGFGGVYDGLFKFLYYWLGEVNMEIRNLVVSGSVYVMIRDGILGFFVIFVVFWYVLVIYFCCVGLLLCMNLDVFLFFF